MSQPEKITVPVAVQKIQPPEEPQTIGQVIGLKGTVPLPVLHQSSVHDTETCPMYGALSAVYRIRRKTRKIGADESSYMHVAMKPLMNPAEPHLSVRAKAARLVCKEAYRLVVQKVKQNQRRSENPEITDQREEELTKAMNVGYAMALRLSSVMRIALDEGAFKIVAAEVPINVAFHFDGGPDGEFVIPYEGTLDLIIMDRKGVLFGVDYKGVSTTLNRWVKQLDYSLQAYCYTHALRAAVRGRAHPATLARLQEFGLWRPNSKKHWEVRGFLFANIIKPSIRRKKLHTDNPQTLKDYVAECNEWWSGTGRHKKLAEDRVRNKPILLHRQLIPREWPYQIVKRLSRAYDDLLAVRDMDVHEIPRHDGQCVFGHIECEMYELCSSGYHLWKDVMSRFYTRNKDVLSSQGELLPSKTGKAKVTHGESAD